MNITGYIPIISTILGVIMGLASSEISNLRRDRRSKRRKINSTRTLISLENERNMELLKDFWFKLNKLEEDDVEEGELKITLAHWLIKMPMPSWNDLMWRKQASFLPITFIDKEIISISSFNNCLELLKSIYSKLIDLDAKDREYNSTYASSGVKLSKVSRSNRFHEEAPGLWDEFEEITLNLIEKGNPLVGIKK
ncbi:hypothetical protein [Methanobacterium formicicum]|uniref:Uncharacterized protein n=1 Tax=Methanobacterium formicicum (strain DSM 3637 / PP1) TaxID=1204725 RepID=K2R5Q8_METFP|nr:hypothetical protein [Methanobacterium formicicum]EKF86572.1 hypothetical protein A994_03778 [Methanobacterium formicicum DSM 3637]